MKAPTTSFISSHCMAHRSQSGSPFRSRAKISEGPQSGGKMEDLGRSPESAAVDAAKRGACVLRRVGLGWRILATR